MKRILKWTGIILGCLIVLGFLFFLYFIPPFTLAPPSAFIEPEQKAGPNLAKIADPAERLIARRGEYLVKTVGCSGCHVAAGPNGAPQFDRYEAGGAKITVKGEGAAYSFNLTPDKETGIGNISKEEIVHILKTGQLPDGRILNDEQMPWTVYSHFSEEDLYAIATYLKSLDPIPGRIPQPDPNATIAMPGALRSISVLDHSGH